MSIPTTDTLTTPRRSWLQRGLALTAATATAVAMGAMTSPAEAGTGSEWDRLAQCESHQQWNTNTGNGYYGGLQFSKGSWDWAGGRQYAAYPHQATRAEQIRTAERLLDLQHVSNAWPYCSSKVGLSHAELQSGSLSGGTSTPSPNKAEEKAPTRSTKSTAPATSGTYTVRSGDTLSRIAARLGVSGGWPALYRANDDRIDSPSLIRVGQTLRVPGSSASTPAPAAGSDGDKASPRRSDDSSTYRVRSGDSLSLIARREGVAGGWPALYRANDDRIDSPSLIRVGQVLRLP